MISSFLPKFLFGRDRNPNKALRRAPRGFDEKQRDRPTEEGRNVCPKEDSLKGDFTRVVLENVEWGMQAFDVAKELLSRTRDIELYSFRAFKSNKVDIRLDKISDTYGSPTLHEIGAFSQQYCALLENSIGEEQIGLLEIEVSSPGAERSVRVPSELERFRGLPMSVRTKDDQTGSKVYEFIAMDDGLTKWRYADVKANRSLGKGKGLTRRQKETIFEIPVDSLDSVNLHIDL